MRLAQKYPKPVAKLLEQLTHTAEGMFAVDAQQRIIVWNKAAEALLGYTAEEVYGKSCCEIIQGRDCNGVLQCVAHCSHFEQGKKLRWVHHMDIQSRSKSGKDIWISITTVSILVTAGVTAGVGAASGRRKLFALVHLFRQAEQTDPAPASLVSLQPSSPGPMAGREDASASPFPLTHREMEVLLLMAEGASTKEVGAQLFISPVTVRNHIQSILKKLDVHTRLEAILWAIRRQG